MLNLMNLHKFWMRYNLLQVKWKSISRLSFHSSSFPTPAVRSQRWLPRVSLSFIAKSLHQIICCNYTAHISPRRLVCFSFGCLEAKCASHPKDYHNLGWVPQFHVLLFSLEGLVCERNSRWLISRLTEIVTFELLLWWFFHEAKCSKLQEIYRDRKMRFLHFALPFPLVGNFWRIWCEHLNNTDGYIDIEPFPLAAQH